MSRGQAGGAIGESALLRSGGGLSMRIARAALHLLAGITLTPSATALRAEEVPLSLAHALTLAEQRNPEFLAQRAGTEAAAARAQAVKRTNWPRLSFSSGWSRTNTPSVVFAQKLNAGAFTQDDVAINRLNSPDALSHLTTILTAEMPLDVSGQVRARAKAQSDVAQASGAMLDESAQSLRLRVVEAYRRAALAQRVAEVAEHALAGARAREADVEARVEEGAALAGDLLRVRARRRQRDAELSERRADSQIAVAILSRTLGADPTISYRPEELPSAPPPLENDGASWLSRAQAERPSLRAASDRLRGQISALRAEERSNRPDLAAWGQLEDDRGAFSAGSQSGAFGLLLRWTVFDPTRGRRVAAASAEAHAADLEARASRDQVRLEVETAWRRAQAARERYAAAAGGAEEGREAIRVVHERYQQGMATLTDELETEAASLAAELEELRAASEAAIADAALLRARGAL
jgi:outer membrane protein